MLKLYSAAKSLKRYFFRGVGGNKFLASASRASASTTIEAWQPLKGTLVVALEHAVAAPYCTMKLADAGARVIKIERAEGDFARGYDSYVNGESAYFVWANRGKESIVLDIKKKDDAALLHRMVSKADVWIQNMAQGATDRAGFGSSLLRSRHPALITVDINGYGMKEGPYASMRAYDLLVQAESGLCSVTGTAESEARVGVSVADIACGATAYTSVLEAVLARKTTGVGCGIEVPLFDTMADWMSVPLLQYEYAKKTPKRIGVGHASICPYGAFGTKDGQRILISIQNEREFARLCEHVLKRPEMAKDPRFCSNEARLANRKETDGAVGEVFGSLTAAELVQLLEKNQIAFGKVSTVPDLSRHPAIRRTEVNSPSGKVRLVSPPGRFTSTKPTSVASQYSRPLGPVPGLGEHTEAIRREFSE